MKSVLTALVLMAVPPMHGQGTLLFYNGATPTRIASIDGPLAGPEIWAQMLVGPTAEDLVPVGEAHAHGRHRIGIVNGGILTLGDYPCFDRVFAQMVVWDSTLWGTSLAEVPLDQLGRTDAVSHVLGCVFDPDTTLGPWFNQAAIVPVPEPSVLALGAAGLALAWLRARRRPPG